MDSKSVRALLCAKLGPVGDIVVDQYVSDVRERALTTSFLMAVFHIRPFSQCEHMGERGCCRKTVTKAAVVQRCGKHQFFPNQYTDLFLEQRFAHWHDNPLFAGRIGTVVLKRWDAPRSVS